MKKLIALILSLTFVLALVGCENTIAGTEVYSFPEPTKQVVISCAFQGEITEYTITYEPTYEPNDLAQPILPLKLWFYGLELKECEKPKPVEGNIGYTFVVDGETAFSFDFRGETAFVHIDNKYYQVKNPSNPPLE